MKFTERHYSINTCQEIKFHNFNTMCINLLYYIEYHYDREQIINKHDKWDDCELLKY